MRDISRIKKNAEVFTPPFLVNRMLNKLPKEVWSRNKTFCDPACGDGNFLVQILWRKLSKGHDSLEALKSIYGTDIMKDNIQECRLRLLKVVSIFDEITRDHVKAVFKNIAWLSKNTYPMGSLEYDFSFRNGANEDTISRWMDWIEKGNALDRVELPVEAAKSGRRRSMDIFEK